MELQTIHTLSPTGILITLNLNCCYCVARRTELSLDLLVVSIRSTKLTVTTYRRTCLHICGRTRSSLLLTLSIGRLVSCVLNLSMVKCIQPWFSRWVSNTIFDDETASSCVLAVREDYGDYILTPFCTWWPATSSMPLLYVKHAREAREW